MELPSPRQKAFFEQAATSYQQQLAGDSPAQEFLRSRGVGLEWAGLFRLGVVRRPLVGHETYSGRLAIPYITPSGVVNFSFRCLQPHKCSETVIGTDPKTEKPVYCPKYLATLLDRTLYNVSALGTKSQVIHVTEGELDALTLTMAGFPAVGTPGVKNWQPWYTLCLQDFAEVYVWGDGDKAGREFAKFLEKTLKARRVAVPRGADVNAVYTAAGAEGLRRLVHAR